MFFALLRQAVNRQLDDIGAGNAHHAVTRRLHNDFINGVYVIIGQAD